MHFKYFFNPFKENLIPTAHHSLLYGVIEHTAVGVVSIAANRSQQENYSLNIRLGTSLTHSSSALLC